ncbi:MAG: hypothetical protein MK554_05845, partial [Planctomycetes bacterium]|nr:hypothetical protein [Planctomycetota bacterium]
NLWLSPQVLRKQQLPGKNPSLRARLQKSVRGEGSGLDLNNFPVWVRGTTENSEIYPINGEEIDRRL